MQLSPEQQKAIEAQKAQCPFCKIIKGEIPSKKVYEDELVIAILDINPANKGHTLVMPKEHYPILPLIPQNVFEHLAVRTKDISRAIKEGVLVFGDNIFIANGAAAGQQSQHFMLHIIPREENDGIDIFKFEKIDVEKDKEAEAFRILSHNLPIMLKEAYKMFPLPGKQSLEGTTEAIRKGKIAYTKDELLKIIEMNPQLKQAIIKSPEQFKQIIPINPQLKELFSNVNIDEIIEAVTGKKPEKIVDAEITKETSQEITKETSQEETGTEEEKNKSEEEKTERYNELFNILDSNLKLKSLLVEHIEILKIKIESIKELKEIFNGIDLENLREAVIKRDKIKEKRNHEQKKEEEQEEKTEKEGAEGSEEEESKEEEEPNLPEAPQEETEETQEEEKEEERMEEKTKKEPDLDTISEMFRREFG